MNSPALTQADIKAIADALGISKQGCQKRANKEAWPFDEVPFAGGNKRVYPLATLPKVVRESIACQHISADAPLSAKLKKAVPALTYPVAPIDPAHCTSKQREEEQARRVVLRKLDELQHASGSSREAAMITMLTMAGAGTLGDALCATLRNALDARGRKGNEYPSVRSLKRWIAKDKAGDLMPKIIQSDMTIQPWHALAISLRQRPQGSTLTWLHDQIEQQWDASWGGSIPSYHVVRRFFVEKFSQIDQLKGRYTGSKLRSHKFYQHRTSEGLVPAMEVHADGWNTHFSAPHPVTGEFVTYEVGNCQPSCRLNTCDYAAILSSNSPSISSSFAAIC